MISPEIQTFCVENSKNVWYHRGDGGYRKGPANTHVMEDTMLRSTTRSALLTAICNVMSAVASQHGPRCESLDAPGGATVPRLRPFSSEELPGAAVDNYDEMAWKITACRRKTLAWGARRPACSMGHYARIVRDHITAVIISEANPDGLLIPVITMLTNLDTKQAGDALDSMKHSMGEYGKRSALFCKLSNALVGCSRRIRYSGLSRSEAIEATLKAIPEIPAEEDWAMLGDYLSAQPGPIGRQTNHDGDTEMVAAEIADTSLLSSAPNHGDQMSFAKFRELLDAYNRAVVRAGQVDRWRPGVSWPWGFSPVGPAMEAYVQARTNRRLGGLCALLKHRTEWCEKNGEMAAAQPSSTSALPKPED
jgi:hypothetical protein